MSRSFIITDSLTDVDSKHTSLITFEGFDDKKNFYTSAKFSQKEKFITELFTNPIKRETSTTATSKVNEALEITKKTNPIIGSDLVYFSNWKNIENISARLIEKYDDIVVLECLIDKDSEIYEEREFNCSLFEGYDLTIGNLFYLRYFERKNEARLEVHNSPELTTANDFPKRNFKQLFQDSKLFK